MTFSLYCHVEPLFFACVQASGILKIYISKTICITPLGCVYKALNEMKYPLLLTCTWSVPNTDKEKSRFSAEHQAQLSLLAISPLAVSTFSYLSQLVFFLFYVGSRGYNTKHKIMTVLFELVFYVIKLLFCIYYTSKV